MAALQAASTTVKEGGGLSQDHIPSLAANSVLQQIGQETLDEKDHPAVKGVDFNKEVTLDDMMEAMATTGFQATETSKAIHEINRMRSWRLSDEPVQDDEEEVVPEVRSRTKCTIFLAYTSNMVSCGVRESIRYLCQHGMVDCLVTTAGGIEEDIMKCIRPHQMGSFEAYNGRDLRLRGINRIGNLLVPNESYCVFEQFMSPILEAMHDEQDASREAARKQRDAGVEAVDEELVWTPSRMIDRLGKEVDSEESIYYWCHKNKIPVFCPAITDGSVGDMLYFASYKRSGFILDIARDIRGINDVALKAKKSGVIIVGGGLVKHHTLNANLMRNGADYSVFINTGQAFDGSDSGAPPDEALSWGKIRIDAQPVKVNCEASIVFPLIVSQTFAKGGPKVPIKTSHTAQPASQAPTQPKGATEKSGL